MITIVYRSSVVGVGVSATSIGTPLSVDVGGSVGVSVTVGLGVGVSDGVGVGVVVEVGRSGASVGVTPVKVLVDVGLAVGFLEAGLAVGFLGVAVTVGSGCGPFPPPRTRTAPITM